MKTDGATPEILLVRCVLFAYVLCPSASGTGPAAQKPFALMKSQWTDARWIDRMKHVGIEYTTDV